jgi:DNA-binding CsgD family transcriptional regulator
MNVKSPPAPCLSNAVVSSAPTEKPKCAPLRRPSVVADNGKAAVDLLADLVRKLTGEPQGADENSETEAAIVRGKIVAETTIEGGRYLLVRCLVKPGDALMSLSPRERDIIDLIAKGYPNKMIADLLEISTWTVGTHLRRVFAKFGVTSRAAMVARYLLYLESQN